MPTLAELEALREKPEQPTAPVVAAPAAQAVAPPAPTALAPVVKGPSLADLAAITNPALNTTMDARSKLDSNLDWTAQFEPGAYVGDTNVKWEDRNKLKVPVNSRTAEILTENTAKNAFANPDYFDQSALNSGETAAGTKVLSGIARGAANTALDTIQAPGYFVKAFHEANILGDNGVKFEYGWDKPLSSLLYGVTDITQKLQDEINAGIAPNRTLAEQFPEAIGSAAAFLAGGALSGAATAAGQAGVAAGLGAASSATSQYEDALSYGADPNDALLSYGAGAAIGSTEGFPGFYFLKRLNKLGGGQLMEKLQALGMQGEHGAIREAIQGGLTEAAQEGFQTVASNWVAKDLAGYDPSRTLGENFWDSVITAGATGSILGGGIQMLHNSELNAAKQKLEEDFQAKMDSGDAINAVATPGNGFGSFTPVETLVQLNKIKDDLDRHIDAKAQIAFDKMAAQATANGDGSIGFPTDAHGIPDEIVPESSAAPHDTMDVGEAHFNAYVGEDAVVNKSTEAALTKGRTEPLPVREALTRTDTVALPTRFDDLLTQIRANIQKTDEALKTPPSADLETSPEDIAANQASLTRQLSMLKLRENQLMQKKAIANHLLGELKNYTAAFRNVLNPDLKMVIRDSNVTRDSSAGWFSGSQNVKLSDGTTHPVGVMYADISSMVDQIYAGGEKANDVEYKKVKRKLFEVVNHELGHSILTFHFHNVLNDVMNGDSETARNAYKTFVLLQDEYREWLKDMSGMKWQGFVENSMPFQRADRFLQGGEQIGLPLDQMSTHEDLPDAWPKKNYLLSFDEFFADMTARLATQGHLQDMAMTNFFKPVLKQYEEAFKTYPAWAQHEYGQNWKQFLQARGLSFKLKEQIQQVQANGSRNLWDGLRGKVEGLNPDNFAGLRHQLDRWNKGISLGLNLLQLERVFPHVPQFAQYRQTTEAWAAYQRNFADKATETLENWRSLGKKDSAALADVLYTESEMRKPMPPAMLSRELTGEALIVYQQIRSQLNHVLDEMQVTALREANREHFNNSEKLALVTKETSGEFAKLKDSGYFPFIRFGDWTINARAKNDGNYLGQDFKAGDLITFQAFESRSERDAAYTKLRNELGGGAAVSAGKMRESEYTVQGMPRSILLALRNRLLADGQLNTEVEKAIDQSLEAHAPFKNFRKHFVKKQGIHGYSEDAYRTFAHYIRSAAGNISRVRYAGEMRESIESAQADVTTIQELGGNSTPRQEMTHWLRRHFDYIMNPANELAALRGVGFVAFLGFNVKSAFVNSTQMLTTVYPYLGARFGDVKAVAELGKAGAWLKKWTLQKKDFMNAKPGSKESRIAELLARGNSEGWLDQSLATELAIAASENSLDRSLYLPSGKRFWHNFSRWSAWPFHIVEKTNRYLTAIAAYNLNYAESGNHEHAILGAKLANQQTHWENSRWNRPEILRGKKSAALLFQNFVQNQLFFIAKDPGAVRYFCIMFLLAGAMGLPGADDLVDVMDAAITKLNKELGMKNPKTQIRVEARKFLDELGANPDLVMHGISQDSFGLGQVGELTGIPVPHFNLSNSIGMGNIIPGTEIPNQIMSGAKPGDVALEAFSQASGASGNLVEDYYRGLFSQDPSEWKRIERLLPLMSMRNLSKAARYATEGKERTANGEVIADFTPYDVRSGLEIFGQGLGFPLSKVQQGWEKEFAARDAAQFYKTWQASVQRQMNIAYLQEDREAIVDAQAALKEYNANVPMPEMGIKSKNVKAAVREFLKDQYKAGMGFAAEKKYTRLMKSVEETFPDPVGDSVRNDVDPRP